MWTIKLEVQWDIYVQRGNTCKVECMDTSACSHMDCGECNIVAWYLHMKEMGYPAYMCHFRDWFVAGTYIDYSISAVGHNFWYSRHICLEAYASNVKLSMAVLLII